jgi:hypothetical protein
VKSKIAILLSCCMLGLSTMHAGATQIEEFSKWESEAPPEFQKSVVKEGKTTVVFVLDQNGCSSCGRMIQQLLYAQADYPNVNIATATAGDWGIPKELLPFALVLTPQCGIIKRLPNYMPSTPEAFKYLMENLESGGSMQKVTRTCK